LGVEPVSRYTRSSEERGEDDHSGALTVSRFTEAASLAREKGKLKKLKRGFFTVTYPP
jgi:hypothetical protein